MRIYLRAFEIEDYKLISEWRHDEEITTPLSGNTYYVSSEREKKWVEHNIFDDKTNIYLAICLKDGDRMIGYTSITNIDLRNQKAEWGGTIIGDKTLWGKGYATEAAKLMLRFLFMEYPIHRCYGYCLEEHKVTERLLVSLGFHQEAKLRDVIFKNGEFKSLLGFSLLREEYIEKHGKNLEQ